MDAFKGALSCLILLLLGFTQLLGFVEAAPWYHWRGNDWADLSTEARLMHDLLARNMKLSRPVMHVNETTRVSFGLALIVLEGIDESAHSMETTVWLRMMWHDTYLRWEPGNYSGIEVVRIPVKKIWTPDLAVYNNRGSMQMLEPLAVVYSDGTVLYIPPARIKSHCNLDLRYFPMDIQVCTIKVGSWTYDGNTIDLEFFNSLENIDLTDFEPNLEWNVLKAEAKKNVKYYKCCNEPYPDLTFTLHLQRLNGYYKFVYIGPAVLLALLAPFIFLLPPADTQKATLGVGLLICFTFFFGSMGNSLPPFNSSTPLLHKYYMTQYVLIVLSIMLSTLVANIARKAIRVIHPPAILSKVVLSGLGRCLCVSQNMYSDLTPIENPLSELAERGEASATTDNTKPTISEWLLIATVIDRLFFLLSIFVTVLMTVIVLNSYPRT